MVFIFSDYCIVWFYGVWMARTWEMHYLIRCFLGRGHDEDDGCIWLCVQIEISDKDCECRLKTTMMNDQCLTIVATCKITKRGFLGVNRPQWCRISISSERSKRHLYSLFTLRRARSPLIINGERALLRVNRLYVVMLSRQQRRPECSHSATTHTAPSSLK